MVAESKINETNNYDRDDYSEIDIEQIIKIQEQCGLSCWTFTDYELELEKKHSLIFVAKIKRRIIGFLAARLLVENLSEAEAVQGKNAAVYSEAEILNLGVFEIYRRRGVGNLLFNELLRKTMDLAIRTIWLEVRISNTEAIKFYSNKGFVEMRQRKNFYSLPTEDAVEMQMKVPLVRDEFEKAAKLDSVADFEITLLRSPKHKTVMDF